jgi:hypothetical protein
MPTTVGSSRLHPYCFILWLGKPVDLTAKVQTSGKNLILGLGSERNTRAAAHPVRQ